MIFETSRAFFLLLGLLTLLGACVGYCIAAIRERHAASNTKQKLQLEMEQQQRASMTELAAARNSIKRLTESGRKSQVTASQPSAAKPEARAQETLIKALEVRLSASEKQRQKLQRDLESFRMGAGGNARVNGFTAGVKNSQQGPLQASTGSASDSQIRNRYNKNAVLSDDDTPPTLSRRVSTPLEAGRPARPFNPPEESGSRAKASSSTLSGVVLPGELDIPKLSESELPELNDELELELSAMDGDENGGHG